MSISENDLRVKQSEEVKNLRSSLVSSQALLEDYKREHGKLESFFRSVREAISPIPYESVPVYKRQEKKHLVASPCVAVMHNTDWHVGAVQEPNEIEGFGEFNPEIAEERILSFARKTVDWVDVHRLGYMIDELSVIVTGDLISGDIHDELRITNAFPSPVQAVTAGQILARQLAMLSPHFNAVNVHFIVEDNHARLTKKPQAKEAGLNSLNYVVGEVAKAYIRDIKNVTFNIYPMFEKVVQVSTRKYLITHGHNVKGWAGFPYYGLDRKVSREALRRMNGPDHNKFDRVIMGHWHAGLAHPTYWIGPSLSGTDAYDHQNARYSRPGQAAWIVHPRHGEFDRTEFYLGGD